jgi:hypothetical protein
MTTFSTPTTSSRRRPGPTTRLRKRVLSAWLKAAGLAPKLACVDGRPMPEACFQHDGHDGRGEFMAETQKLIGVSLEGSVG